MENLYLACARLSVAWQHHPESFTSSSYLFKAERGIKNRENIDDISGSYSLKCDALKDRDNQRNFTFVVRLFLDVRG